jgi:hypothetical protein
MSVSIGGKIVTDGLVIHYDALNGKSYPGSGTSWIDLTPYNNNGDLDNGNNPVTIANGYASFVSSSYRIMEVNGISEVTQSTAYVTVDMWAKIPSVLNSGTVILDPYMFGFFSYGISFRVNTNGVPTGLFGFTTNSVDKYGINNLSFIENNLINKWAHYSFVMCEGSVLAIPYTNQKIYINSIPLSMDQVAGSDDDNLRRFSNIPNTPSNLFFGTRFTSSTIRPMNYDAALIKVYNRELTQAEVTQNFNAHKGRFNIY